MPLFLLKSSNIFKLNKNEYSSKGEKQRDLEEFMKLYAELGEAEKLEMKDSGIFEKIMNKEENINSHNKKLEKCIAIA